MPDQWFPEMVEIMLLLLEVNWDYGTDDDDLESLPETVNWLPQFILMQCEESVVEIEEKFLERVVNRLTEHWGFAAYSVRWTKCTSNRFSCGSLSL